MVWGMSEDAAAYAGPPPPDDWINPVPFIPPGVITQSQPIDDFKDAVVILLRMPSEDRARLRKIIDALEAR